MKTWEFQLNLPCSKNAHSQSRSIFPNPSSPSTRKRARKQSHEQTCTPLEMSTYQWTWSRPFALVLKWTIDRRLSSQQSASTRIPTSPNQTPSSTRETPSSSSSTRIVMMTGTSFSRTTRRSTSSWDKTSSLRPLFRYPQMTMKRKESRRMCWREKTRRWRFSCEN